VLASKSWCVDMGLEMLSAEAGPEAAGENADAKLIWGVFHINSRRHRCKIRAPGPRAARFDRAFFSNTRLQQYDTRVYGGALLTCMVLYKRRRDSHPQARAESASRSRRPPAMQVHRSPCPRLLFLCSSVRRPDPRKI
jgi:hypothetical protein